MIWYYQRINTYRVLIINVNGLTRRWIQSKLKTVSRNHLHISITNNSLCNHVTLYGLASPRLLHSLIDHIKTSHWVVNRFPTMKTVSRNHLHIWSITNKTNYLIITHMLTYGKVDQALIPSDTGVWPDRRQAISRTNVGILAIGPLRVNSSDILMKIQLFSFKKTKFKSSSAKCRPFCLGFKCDNGLGNSKPLPWHITVCHFHGSIYGITTGTRCFLFFI